jgi:hypothetical protein
MFVATKEQMGASNNDACWNPGGCQGVKKRGIRAKRNIMLKNSLQENK